MKRYDADEIRTFLQAVDRHLTTPTRVVIIGGSAAALAHGATSSTQDVDTFQSSTAQLRLAVDRAREETLLEIPMEDASVADIPHDAELRLERQLPELIGSRHGSSRNMISLSAR
jgi:hypothetical protein